jgi:hypothetical protein
LVDQGDLVAVLAGHRGAPVPGPPMPAAPGSRVPGR